MIFKSHQVNLDPKPYLVMPGRAWPEIEPFRVPTRGAAEATMYRDNFDGKVEFDPRPEFEPTRDPEPWVGRSPVTGDPIRTGVRPAGLADLRWSPRAGTWHGYDTPVNPILVAFRAERRQGYSARAWYDLLVSEPEAFGATPEQADHARRVLRLIALMEGAAS